MKKKVIVIGLDGLEPSIVEAMLERGELPHFAKIRQAGFYSVWLREVRVRRLLMRACRRRFIQVTMFPGTKREMTGPISECGAKKTRRRERSSSYLRTFAVLPLCPNDPKFSAGKGASVLLTGSLPTSGGSG